MAAPISSSEFLSKFRKISAKLKKYPPLPRSAPPAATNRPCVLCPSTSVAECRRVLRKPNYAEALDEFQELKLAVKREECSPYAAFCAMAQAKCEQALNRSLQAAASHEEAGTPLRLMRAALSGGVGVPTARL